MEISLESWVLLAWFTFGSETLPTVVDISETEEQCWRENLPLLDRFSGRKFISGCLTVREALDKYEDLQFL